MHRSRTFIANTARFQFSVIETSEQKAEEYNHIHNEKRERNDKEKGRGDENHAVCTSYTHIRALCACTEYPCSGYLRISLRADGFGSDTERHADHDRCRDQYVVFRRQTCARCGNNADGRLSLVFRAVEDLRRGKNATYPLLLCVCCVMIGACLGVMRALNACVTRIRFVAHRLTEMLT